MSTWDLFEDGFPHGTADGYRKGCRGGACPAGIEHGLACRVAYQKAAGDYQYGRLVAAGHTPAEIAAELGIGPTTHEAPTRHAAVPAHLEEEPIMNAPAPTATVTKPTPATVAAAAKKPRKSPEGPSQSAVREWAHANGVDVNPRGAVRRDVVDQYLAAQNTPRAAAEETPDSPDGTEAAPDETPEPVDETPTDLEEPEQYGKEDSVTKWAEALTATVPATHYAVHTATDDIAEQLAQLNAHLEHLRDERDEAQRALNFTLRQWHEARTTAALNAIHLADARAAERTLLDALQSAEDDLAASRALADHYRVEAQAADARAARPWWKRNAS